MTTKKVNKIQASEEYDDYEHPLTSTYKDDLFNAFDEEAGQADTLPIMDIIPDMTQGRRVLPDEIRRLWDGTARGYGVVIDAWENGARILAPAPFPVDILMGGVSPLVSSDDPLALDFAEMLSFAANIRDIGLNHPIGVVKRGELYRIVYGERRWTAFQFLNHYLGGTEDWRNIRARTIVATDWQLAKAQAAENNQSKRMNAIGRAREFAKLLMIARADGGERYDSWNQLVVAGGCDRYWYAQVANGEIHRIPRNMGPQFEQALNISVGQMRNYRNLLRLTEDHKINDVLWMLGDKGNWSENFLREVALYLDVSEIAEILNLKDDYTVTTVTVYESEVALQKAVKAAKEAAELAKNQAEPPVTITDGDGVEDGESDTVNDTNEAGNEDNADWPSRAWLNKTAYSGNVELFVKSVVDSDRVIAIAKANGDEVEVHISKLRERTESDAKPVTTPVKPTGTSTRWDKFGNQPNPTATPPTIKEDVPDDEDDTPTPFAQSNSQLALQSFADTLFMFGIAEHGMIEDFAKVNRETIYSILKDGGLSLVDEMADGYLEAAENALENLWQHIQAQVAGIRTAAREMIEES